MSLAAARCLQRPQARARAGSSAAGGIKGCNRACEPGLSYDTSPFSLGRLRQAERDFGRYPPTPGRGPPAARDIAVQGDSSMRWADIHGPDGTLRAAPRPMFKPLAPEISKIYPASGAAFRYFICVEMPGLRSPSPGGHWCQAALAAAVSAGVKAPSVRFVWVVLVGSNAGVAALKLAMACTSA